MVKLLPGTYYYCLYERCDKQRYIRKLCHFQLLMYVRDYIWGGVQYRLGIVRPVK